MHLRLGWRMRCVVLCFLFVVTVLNKPPFQYRSDPQVSTTDATSCSFVAPKTTEKTMRLDDRAGPACCGAAVVCCMYARESEVSHLQNKSITATTNKTTTAGGVGPPPETTTTQLPNPSTNGVRYYCYR
jgi:hypothetical protein